MDAQEAKGQMLISEIGRLNSHRQSGFTLIELLVSITVVGILLAVVVLNVNLVSDNREMQTEARRFAALLEVAEEDASMQGREFGIELMNGAYRFVEYDVFNERWDEIFADDTLRMRTLPESYRLELYLEDKRVLLNDAPAVLEETEERRTAAPNDAYSPHLLVYSSGDIMPFELRLYREFDERQLLLRRDATGSFELSADEDG